MSLTSAQRAALASDFPLRLLSGKFFRQTHPPRQPLELPTTARRDARWHRAGDPWPAYAADSQLAAMLQLPRYFEVSPSEPPVLPHRRMSELHVSDLLVMDLANELALEVLDLEVDELRHGLNGSPEAELCREIADIARGRSDVLGILAPSAALSGARDLVIFPEGFPHVVVGAQSLVELVVAPAPRAQQPDS